MVRCGVIGLLLAVLATASATYKLCVLPHTSSYYSSAEICDKLGPTGIQCVIAVDRLECLKKLSVGSADFAVLEAEDILIAADDEKLSDILITHKIHATTDRKWEFAVVALVSNKVDISNLSDLKGKRLCHPGNDPFSTNYDWSEVFSLYFENRVAPQLCEKQISVEENRVKALAGFFGEACKPGVWAADPDLDIQLKTKYKNLCELCDVPSVCSQRDKYWGRRGALYCLSDCLGDVAWSMLKDARLHFSDVDVAVCNDVSLLCPDGSKMALNSTEPCVWVTRPVPVIAAKRKRAAEIQQIIGQVLMKADTPDGFIRLLEANRLTPPLQVDPSSTPNDYLANAPGYLSANKMSVCGQGSRAVRLCVSTLNGKVKCEWLSAVARVYGVQPSITCLYGPNCQLSVANGSADVIIADTDVLLPATRDYHLKPLLVQVPLHLKKARTVSAVVKSSSKITKYSDLKGKKACFPSVDGFGWSSFTKHMLQTNSFGGVCPYIKSMSMYFSDICISEPSTALTGYPNIKMCAGEYHGDYWNDDGDMLNESFDNEAIAFQCLIMGGDVAFISTDSIPKFLEAMKDNPDAEGLSVDNFRPICEGAPTTSDCYLAWASNSQVLVHEKMPASREEDVRSLFTSLNSLFGYQNSPSTRTFGLFAPSNSLFDVSVEPGIKQRLEQMDDFIKKAKQRPNNFETMIKSVEKCTPSKTSHISSSSLLVLVVFCYSLFLKSQIC